MTEEQKANQAAYEARVVETVLSGKEPCKVCGRPAGSDEWPFCSYDCRLKYLRFIVRVT